MPDNQEDNAINERIKLVRHTLKLSQAKFAKAIHISNGYQAEIELGHCKVRDHVIALIVAVFGVNEQWLRTGSEEMFLKTPTQKLERMTSLFNELYPEFQDYILNQIDQLICLQNIKHGD
ncbi:hypothetical protein FACS1894172_10020 [Spirochaetia bacterium]|nr:hypothetical protein FACS1894164_20320 [Spirochaetia bacterium]GHU32772.1 hypothetical protein FACS1894172_10020 [Spirochaetia bacterium]